MNCLRIQLSIFYRRRHINRPHHLHTYIPAASGRVGQQFHRIGGCRERGQTPHLLKCLLMRAAHFHFRLLDQMFQIGLVLPVQAIELIDGYQQVLRHQQFRLTLILQINAFRMIIPQHRRQKQTEKSRLRNTLPTHKNRHKVVCIQPIHLPPMGNHADKPKIKTVSPFRIRDRHPVGQRPYPVFPIPFRQMKQELLQRVIARHPCRINIPPHILVPNVQPLFHSIQANAIQHLRRDRPKTETERMFLPILHLTNNLILAKLIPPFQEFLHPCQQIHRFRQTGFLPERLTCKIYIMYRHPQQVLVAKTPYSGIDPTDNIFFRNSGIKTK